MTTFNISARDGEYGWSQNFADADEALRCVAASLYHGEHPSPAPNFVPMGGHLRGGMRGRGPGGLRQRIKLLDAAHQTAEGRQKRSEVIYRRAGG